MSRAGRRRAASEMTAEAMTSDERAEAVLGELFSAEAANVYAVLDGASVPGLVPRLYDARPEFECLYRGELEPDIAEVAPYLVRLDPDEEFADWVVREDWGRHWGVFAASDEDLPGLCRHLRTLLTVYDPEGRPLLFRYYDPRVLRLYLPTCNQQELQTVFGPVVSYLLEDEDPKNLLRFQFMGGTLRQERHALEEEEG